MDAIPVYRLGAIDSTNAEARRKLDAGAGAPFWVVAEEQVEGRGRRGRTWVSKPGNLYASCALPLRGGSLDPSGFVFAATLAVREAIVAMLAGTPAAAHITLKWPNDVVYEKAKLSGILLESVLDRRGQPRAVIIGCGINCAHAPDLPDRPAASIKALEGNQDPHACFDVLTRTMAHWLQRLQGDGFPPLRAEWLCHATGKGEPLTVRLPGETFDGIFEGLDERGQLLVRLGKHERRTVSAGDVFYSGQSS